MPLISQRMSSWSDFYLMSTGSQEDVHAPHFNFAPFTNKYKGSDRNLDTVLLMPGASLSVEVHRFAFRSPGRWLIRCAVNEHFQNGMMAEYEAINQCELLKDRHTIDQLPTSMEYSSRVLTRQRISI